MNRNSSMLVLLLFTACCCAGGCFLRESTVAPFSDRKYFREVAADVAFPDAVSPFEQELMEGPAPRSIRAGHLSEEMWDLTLEEALQIAVSRSTVMRDLGGTVVRSPANSRTILEPAIEETDPRQGVYAALSAFDAAYASSLVAEKNDRVLNNLFTAGGTRLFQQDLILYNQQITKRSAAGSEFALRQNIEYDANNAFANLFPSAWNTNIEAAFRQPLLQGAGVEFNRIAGPGNDPGNLNGVMIARTRTETSLADFELGLRDLVSNVENAYWDLYYAYRDLDAKVNSRNATLEIWRRVSSGDFPQQRGASNQREAQAREQYYRLEEDVQNALSGRPGDGTATNNGTSGGAFRGQGGVLYCERRLRLMLGLGITDGKLIRPKDEPVMVPIYFDWGEISAEALMRRAEVRRQQVQVRRRELELAGTRNFLLPQLDAIGLYRFRGFGQQLISHRREGVMDFDNAFGNLTGGDFQEWQLGAELSFPIGFRRAHAALRHAQLQLARERAILDEQQRHILYDLSNAYSELDRAYAVAQTTYNRLAAAKTNVTILRARTEMDESVDLDLWLDAERRYVDAEIRFHRAAVEYVLAVKNVHFEKGTLLDYGQVFLAELAVPSEGSLRGAIPEPEDLPPQSLPPSEESESPSDIPRAPQRQYRGAEQSGTGPRPEPNPPPNFSQ
jgi:hypothetical protein